VTLPKIYLKLCYWLLSILIPDLNIIYIAILQGFKLKLRGKNTIFERDKLERQSSQVLRAVITAWVHHVKLGRHS